MASSKGEGFTEDEFAVLPSPPHTHTHGICRERITLRCLTWPPRIKEIGLSYIENISILEINPSNKEAKCLPPRCHLLEETSATAKSQKYVCVETAKC
jgi:hypothetical protein